MEEHGNMGTLHSQQVRYGREGQAQGHQGEEVRFDGQTGGRGVGEQYTGTALAQQHPATAAQTVMDWARPTVA